MPSWNIDPGGVGGVLDQTYTVASEFEDHVETMGTALGGSAVEASSEIIAEALGGFVEAGKRNIQFVFDRTGSAMNGTVEAVNAYLEGDLEMAANAQAAAAGVLPPEWRPDGLMQFE